MNPVSQFQLWYDEALSRKIPDVDSMVLATATNEGRPSARVVLFKGIEKGGLVFYTNSKSRKGLELKGNPYAALLFHWPALSRQIRIEGKVEQLSRAMSDEYWKSRPRENQLSGYVSEQSQVIPSYESLTLSVQEARERFRGQEIPRPEHWGGYRVVPDAFEFWIGQESRLHQRICYRFSAQGWKTEFLSP